MVIFNSYVKLPEGSTTGASSSLVDESAGETDMHRETARNRVKRHVFRYQHVKHIQTWFRHGSQAVFDLSMSSKSSKSSDPDLRWAEVPKWWISVCPSGWRPGRLASLIKPPAPSSRGSVAASGSQWQPVAASGWKFRHSWTPCLEPGRTTWASTWSSVWLLLGPRFEKAAWLETTEMDRNGSCGTFCRQRKMLE